MGDDLAGFVEDVKRISIQPSEPHTGAHAVWVLLILLHPYAGAKEGRE
jgi:hypothetical protein